MKNYTLKGIGIATLIAGLNLIAIGPASPLAAQYRPQPVVRTTPAPVFRPAPTFETPAPRYTPAPAPRPAPAPAPEREERPAPQYHPAPAREEETQHYTQPNSQVQNQEQQNEARAQREQQELQQRQQEQARQQKQAQEQEQRQQQQKAQELKQQQKVQEKQEQAQQKEQARQQKEMEKLQKKQGKTGNTSEATTARTFTGSSPSSMTGTSPKNHTAFTLSGNNAVASKTADGASVLTHDGSRNVINQLNASRSSMNGINRKPLPTGDAVVHSNGSLTVKDSSGRQYGVRANGTISSFTANGKAANFNSNGKVTSVHTASMDIRHAPNGQRIVVSHPSNDTTVVATGRHSGYIEHTFNRNGQTYVQRTVLANNRIVTNTYVGYSFEGVALTHFVSPVFYSPAFYGWAFYPWVTPVAYTWGWYGAPWYVGPNPYFVASSTYPSAGDWLTDYYLGQTLAEGYQESQEAIADDANESDASSDSGNSEDDSDNSSTIQASGTTPITPELKSAIAEEVMEQIAAENTAQAHPERAASFAELPSIVNEHNHVFVVANPLEVSTVDQQECELQAGDALQLTAPPSDGSPLAQLRVASSQIMDCPAGVQINVSLQDLQDMQNNFRAQIATGLQTLRNNQGKGGLPAAPPEALSAPPRPAVTGVETIPSTQVMSTLESETRQADALELELTQSAVDSEEARKN